jgi:hypothetical protein
MLNRSMKMPTASTTSSTDITILKRFGPALSLEACLPCCGDGRSLKPTMFTLFSPFILSTYSESIVDMDAFSNINVIEIADLYSINYAPNNKNLQLALCKRS